MEQAPTKAHLLRLLESDDTSAPGTFGCAWPEEWEQIYGDEVVKTRNRQFIAYFQEQGIELDNTLYAHMRNPRLILLLHEFGVRPTDDQLARWMNSHSEELSLLCLNYLPTSEVEEKLFYHALNFGHIKVLEELRSRPIWKSPWINNRLYPSPIGSPLEYLARNNYPALQALFTDLCFLDFSSWAMFDLLRLRPDLKVPANIIYRVVNHEYDKEEVQLLLPQTPPLFVVGAIYAEKTDLLSIMAERKWPASKHCEELKTLAYDTFLLLRVAPRQLWQPERLVGFKTGYEPIDSVIESCLQGWNLAPTGDICFSEQPPPDKQLRRAWLMSQSCFLSYYII